MFAFKVGDCVRLKKIEGPTMLVTEINIAANDDLTAPLRVKCTWFEGKKAHSELFLPEALELAEDVSGKPNSRDERQGQSASRRGRT